MKSNTLNPRFLFCLATILVIAGLSHAQNPTNSDPRADRDRAIGLATENRYVDAYPLLERISASFPQDKEVWTHYGIAIAIRSATLPEAKQRKAERMRALEVLTKARALGTENTVALEMLDQLYPDGGEEDNFLDENPEVERALREGELYFGKGDYAQAFVHYQRAHRLNPKSYEAAVFAGDAFYAQKKYRESEPWFEKAAAINPDRQMAFRFWGDALLEQGKTKEAQEKFIDAFIAEPYSRFTWENINKLTSSYGKLFDVKGVFPPGTENFGAIVIDEGSLSETDGTKLWTKYLEFKKEWRNGKFKRTFPNDQYRESLSEVVESLRSVAVAASTAIKAGKLKAPHHSLKNLIELNEKGFLEPYVLLLAANEEVAGDYEKYRALNRAVLRKFLSEHVFVLARD